MRRRYGVIKRASPEDRTYLGVVHESKLNCSRAMQLEAQKQNGLIYECYPTFQLGPDITYRADFRVWTPNTPHLFWSTVHKPKNGIDVRMHSVDVPHGWVEDCKGPVRTGIGNLKMRWRKYGSVPLIILTGTGRATGLTQRWRREVVVPDSMNPKRKAKNAIL